MRKFILSLFFAITAIAIQAQEPAVTMTTSTSIGSTFSFSIGATANNTPIQVDWGNGMLVNYTIGTTPSFVSGTLAGNTIKIYGVGIISLGLNERQLTFLDVTKNTALTYLNCDSNKLTALDVTKNTALINLYCYSNQLTALDVSNCTALKSLHCSSNQLTALDVTKNTALTDLNCFSNRLTALDLTNNAALTALSCQSNQLTDLNVTKNIALIYLYCYSNQLTALDVTKNTALINLYCYSNQLTALDVSDCTALESLHCYSNQLIALDVSQNTALTTLRSGSNKLSFATLPIKQASWTTYTYSPQAKLTLPKTEYALNEEVDLSSQLAAGGNTTAYIWKTTGGVMLVKDVDYTENNGKFTFIKQLDYYFYCEMRNATFPELTLVTENIFITPTEPSVTMITTTTVGSTFSFLISATANNAPIKVDWGNGTLASYTIETTSKTISGTLTGNTIKIYGVGINYLFLYDKKLTSLDITNSTALTELNCNSNQLTALDVTKNTALTYLDCGLNQLTALDVTKNTALTYFFCHLNKLTVLDVTKNTALTYLDCLGNQLTALDVSQNTVLTTLRNEINKLTFATLPIKQANWTSYTYSSQAKLTLPENEYALNEEVDLSSQLTAGGNTTNYVWKTASGITLIKDVDYTESNGKFTFIKQPGDYFYCEMRNATFPELTLATENISITQTEPSITMITTTTVGSTFSFYIGATADNTPIQMDWGNGTLANYTIGTSSSTVSGTLAGNTIKIYGVGIDYMDLTSKKLTFLDITNNTTLTNLYCVSNQLTALDVSQNTALTTLNSASNKLTFATLPIKQASWTSYTYSPQAKLTLPKTEYALNEEVDLSGQLTAGGNTTTYIWKTISGVTLVKNVDYTESNGKFTFKTTPFVYIYCEMKNTTFPNLTLTTENIYIITTTPGVVMTTTTTVGSNFSFTIGAAANNIPIKVDWGNGALASYTIGTSSRTVSGTLTGNTIKIYGMGINYMGLYNKKLTSLDVTNNTELTTLYCESNQLAALDVSQNTALTTLSCASNKLTFATLPIKQASWNTYTYSPQAKLTLPKKEYALNEEVDLSSQLVAGGNTTAYVWKTIKGITLVKNVDYTENNGVFVFLKAYSDSVYCQMTNATFPELTLITNNIATYLPLPTISMVSASAIGSNFFFDISAKENTPITVDFGNGLLSNYIMGINSSRIEGNLSGDTVKIWGVDIEYISVSWMELTSLNVSNALDIKSLHCNFNQLTSLDISKNIQLDHLYCDNNQLESLDLSNNTNLQYVYNQNNYLTFATLPQINTSWFSFSYSPQFPLKMEKAEYSVGEVLDLSSQLNVNGTVTTYAWVTSSGNNLTKDVDYAENNGKFTFLKGQPETIYCQMTNATFPSLTLETEAISVTLTSPSITLSTTSSTGNTFAFIASASDDNTYVIVDWGNGSTTNHTIGVNESSISGTLAGNTVKVYGSGITMFNVESKNLSELNISGASSLQKLLCNNNQLVTLDISKNDKLQHLDCRQNRIETLDLSKNILLESLFCSNNEISLLSVLNNPAINVLRCESNRFRISTLPLKQNSWTTYSYSPQAKVDLPQKQYSLTETVDLSSELTVNGNTTGYIWKTKEGTTLTAGTDYNVTNGVTTFLMVQPDSVYCEMSNATFPDLTLTTSAIKVTEPIPSVIMTTTMAISSTFSFGMGATADNTTIHVDWGNGSLVSYTINTSYSNVNGTLSGNTIKVYGEGITKLYLSSKNLTAIDVSGATQLTHLDCHSNQLTSLDVSKNLALQELKCSINQLTSLDVTKNTSLKRLFCDSNQITTLDVSQNTALQDLYCDSNLLTILDVTSNTLLQELLCFSNQLTNLDISKNLALKELWCYSNKLNSLDVSKNTALEFLFCESNQLDNLDLSQNTALTEVRCHANNLTFSTLPIKETAWTTYIYSPQNVIKLSKKQYGLTETVDLSSELTVNSNNTNYTWKTKGGVTLTAGTDYNVNNGITTFLKVQTDSVYCQMTNATFPDLTLTTSNIKVSEYPLSVGDNKLTISVYPNPATDNFTIKMAEEIVRVEVYTITGVKVFENGLYSSTTVTVPLSSMPKGALLIKAYTRNGVYSGKVVKI